MQYPSHVRRERRLGSGGQPAILEAGEATLGPPVGPPDRRVTYSSSAPVIMCHWSNGNTRPTTAVPPATVRPRPMSTRKRPTDWTFSRTYAEFAASGLPEGVHEALIRKSYAEEIEGHISRGSTSIEEREKPMKKTVEVAEDRQPKKRGTAEERRRAHPRAETVGETDRRMSLREMLDDLPKPCDVGTKRNSKGYKRSWVGCKLHIDAADWGFPISGILTSASSHDSQGAIPLATLSSIRVTKLYNLVDSAYDAPEIHEHSHRLDHVPPIDINPRREKAPNEELANESKRRKTANYHSVEVLRYNERSTVE